MDAETALLRTLRDIADGHLSLWVRMRNFDPVTGAPLDPPQILYVTPDRQPYAGIPDRNGHWWNELIDRGWLQPPPPGSAQMRMHLSEAGRQALTHTPPSPA